MLFESRSFTVLFATSVVLSFVAGASLGLATQSGPQAQAAALARARHAARADRLDIEQRLEGRRAACLLRDWIKLSQDCAELFSPGASDPTDTASATVLIPRPGGTTAVRMPRPESGATFR